VLTSAALAVAAENSEGSIVSIADDHFVLEVDTAQQMFQWNEETAVTLNGATVEITELKAGDEAVVTYDLSDDGKMVATRIAATRA
jgi:hypothetical protein